MTCWPCSQKKRAKNFTGICRSGNGEIQSSKQSQRSRLRLTLKSVAKSSSNVTWRGHPWPRNHRRLKLTLKSVKVSPTPLNPSSLPFSNETPNLESQCKHMNTIGTIPTPIVRVAGRIHFKRFFCRKNPGGNPYRPLIVVLAHLNSLLSRSWNMVGHN